jgi:hypothetical protein
VSLLTPGSSLNVSSTALNRLTSALILHPIAGGLALFAFIFGIIGIAFASRFATVLMGLFATLGAFTALVIFVIDMVLWNIIKNNVSSAGGSATLVSGVSSSGMSGAVWEGRGSVDGGLGDCEIAYGSGLVGGHERDGEGGSGKAMTRATGVKS